MENLNDISILKNTAVRLSFRGLYDDSSEIQNPKPGDIFIRKDDNMIYCFDDGLKSWHILDIDEEPSEDKQKEQPQEVHALVCKKCGAPLELHNGEGKCQYCGTSYSTHYKIE